MIPYTKSILVFSSVTLVLVMLSQIIGLDPLKMLVGIYGLLALLFTISVFHVNWNDYRK